MAQPRPYQPRQYGPAPTSGAATSAKGPGVLSLIRRNLDQRLSESKIALLRADRLNDLYRDRESFAREIRGLSRWLGRDIRIGIGDRSAGEVVRLAEVEEDGRKKVRLLLTDEGVSALARRFGISFFIAPDLAPLQGEHAMVKVRAVLPGNRVVDKIGRSEGTDQVALQRAEAAAQRAAVYDHLGIRFSHAPRYLAMDFVTRDFLHNPLKPRRPASRPATVAVDSAGLTDTVDLVAPPPPQHRRPDEMALLASSQQLDDLYQVALAYGISDRETVQERVARMLGENVPVGRLTTEEADRIIAQPDAVFGRAATVSTERASQRDNQEEQLF